MKNRVYSDSWTRTEPPLLGVCLLASLLFLTGLPLIGAEFDPYSGPKPLLVMIQTEPWATVIGADTPRVAVYEDGTLLFQRSSEKYGNYYRKALSPSELTGLKAR